MPAYRDEDHHGDVEITQKTINSRTAQEKYLRG
jgi:hypothetical protein